MREGGRQALRVISLFLSGWPSKKSLGKSHHSSITRCHLLPTAALDSGTLVPEFDGHIEGHMHK
jgi:hypothetical protein